MASDDDTQRDSPPAPVDGLTGMAAGAEPAVDDAAMRLYAQLAALLAAHDRVQAVCTAVDAVGSGDIEVGRLYREVLGPLLVHAAEGWHGVKPAIWEEHMASATIRTVVEALYPVVLEAKAAAQPAGRSVLLACTPEEGHDLGLRMVADRFDLAGWTTHYLGPETPVGEIAAAARSLGVDAVVLSSSTHSHRLAVRKAVDALREELPGVEIWAGGPAFVGASTGWLAQETVDLDALLGDGPPKHGEGGT